MNKQIIFISIIFLGVLVTILFQLKHEVEFLEKDLRKNLALIDEHEKNLAILEAEWSYLSGPLRIQNLSNEYLDLKPITIDQSRYIEEIPFRKNVNKRKKTSDNFNDKIKIEN
ncbi:hypothetical protein OAK17_00170 [Alphaproteobacteria bacterium]|nr:hypothetical protein [Alphaproteobacteria bacterium]